MSGGVPSQRRSLPPPANSVAGNVRMQANSHGTNSGGVYHAPVPIQSSGSNGPHSSSSSRASAGLPAAAAAAAPPASNAPFRSSSAGSASPAGPAAATFPWSSRPSPSDYCDGQIYSANTTTSCPPPPPSSSSLEGYVDLSATPDNKVRRSHSEYTADAGENHSGRSNVPPVQHADPRRGTTTAAAAGAAAHLHGDDASLAFALGEDNELKVLVSRVGPAMHRNEQVNVNMSTSGTNSRRVAVGAGEGASAGGLVSYAPPAMGHSNGSGGSYPAYAGDGAAMVAPHHHFQQRCPPPNHAVMPASNTHPQPHTPSVYRGPVMQSADPTDTNGVPLPKPSVQVAHQRLPAGVRVPQPATGGAPIYRSSPHELRSPPALHVCPSGIPGTGVNVPSFSSAAGISTGAVAAAAAGNSAMNSVNGAASQGSSSRPRWGPNRHPSPAAAPYSAPSSQHPSSATGRSGSSGANTVAGNGAERASTSAAAAPCDGDISTGAASNGGCSHHLHSASADARSLHDATPPPSSSSQPPSQPIEKTFTAAQLNAVHKEVQQELFLNYTSVAVPADMINNGDTDERQRRLEQRKKQIVYGKETDGYAKYTFFIPRPCDREYHNPLHAVTPRPEYDCSKRQFDRVLNAWRRQLHLWDDCDIEHPEERFRPLGKATLLELGLVLPPATRTPPTTTTASGAGGAAAPAASGKPPLQPTGVMHSIANVAAMAHEHRADGEDDDAHEEEDAASHTRSPVFTEGTPTSGLYSSANLSMHLNSGRVASMAAAACTPSRPQMSESGEGPQVDESFFLHMNSGNSRIASPFHATYSGTGHVAGNGGNGGGIAGANSSGSLHTGTAAGPATGRSSTGSYYQQFMRNNSYAHNPANPATGGTPGHSYTTHTGLTPSHRPASRSSMPHHISAIFGTEYELMTPSGPGSPSGMPHNPRSGGSPYRFVEPWMPSRRSPTYPITVSTTTGHPAGLNGNGQPSPSVTTTSTIATANSAGTMVITGHRGESPLQTAEPTLIPSTSQSSSGGFAQSPYGYRVHSPVQPQQQQQQHSTTTATSAYATPLTRQHSRPGLPTNNSANNNYGTPSMALQSTVSPSRSPIGLPSQQQHERVAIATNAAAVSRSRRGSGIGGGAPTSWTPPNTTQAPVRPSPHTPQLHLAATPPSTNKRTAVPE